MSQALAEAAKKRAEAAEKRELARARRLAPQLRSAGAVIPGEDARIVAYINKQLAREHREDADKTMLRKRRSEILAAAERRTNGA